ncbi:MAG: sigma-70 family RNA polymerase sigma factor [Kiritimatiellaeota bacterium]|nr:sigma-70 family RNA polymerase sigma factor [Kiritimatiellota bacterium]
MGQPAKKWIAAYRQGDIEALGCLVEYYRRPLFGFILRMTTSVADAEDIFQEVWFRAIRHLDSYREKNFLSWLFRIARNLVIDRARHAKPRVHLADAEAAAEPTPWEARIPFRGPGPDRLAQGHDLGPRIAAALQRLPPEQREVFAMRMEGGLPFKEIARLQATSINTVLARMHYALIKLRQELKKDYEDFSGVRT